MFSINIDKYLKKFLKDIFCGVSRNSPYKNNDFLCILVDAAEHEEFTNNSAIRVGGPTGETVFTRLKDADFDKINNAFYSIMETIFPIVKRLLYNLWKFAKFIGCGLSLKNFAAMLAKFFEQNLQQQLRFDSG